MPDCCTQSKGKIWKIFLGVAIFVGALAALSAREARQEPSGYGEGSGARKQVVLEAEEQSVPYRLGGLERREVIQGAEALAEIAHLHGKALELTRGSVSHYGIGKARATLWVGSTPSPEKAGMLIEEMTEGIRRGRSPFSGLQMVETGGRKVYRLSGLGQGHVYFAAGKRTVWAAADSVVIGRVEDELVRRYAK